MENIIQSLKTEESSYYDESDRKRAKIRKQEGELSEITRDINSIRKEIEGLCANLKTNEHSILNASSSINGNSIIVFHYSV